MKTRNYTLLKEYAYDPSVDGLLEFAAWYDSLAWHSESISVINKDQQRLFFYSISTNGQALLSKPAK